MRGSSKLLLQTYLYSDEKINIVNIDQAFIYCSKY